MTRWTAGQQTAGQRQQYTVQRDNLAGSQLRQFARRVIECGSRERADSVPSVRDCGSNEMSSETDIDGDSRRLNGDDNDKYNDNDSDEKHDLDRSLDNVWKQLRQISRSKKKYSSNGVREFETDERNSNVQYLGANDSGCFNDAILSDRSSQSS